MGIGCEFSQGFPLLSFFLIHWIAETWLMEMTRIDHLLVNAILGL